MLSDAAFQLLHCAPFGALATQSVQMPGYPYASALPFVPDQQHRPVFLISGLAEHTKNLGADSRASLLVAGSSARAVLESARLTLVGDVQAFDPPAGMVARYLRYQPDAEQYLALGDFAFFRFIPKRARFVAGFGRMGWLEESEWNACAVLPLADEERLIGELMHAQPAALPGLRVLGLDCYGCDVERGGRRERLQFAQPPVAPDQAGAAALAVLR